MLVVSCPKEEEEEEVKLLVDKIVCGASSRLLGWFLPQLLVRACRDADWDPPVTFFPIVARSTRPCRRPFVR